MRCQAGERQYKSPPLPGKRPALGREERLTYNRFVVIPFIQMGDCKLAIANCKLQI
jgi:hypothetical protein